ncbi:hypothetical protein [Psychromicrobium lacuslunae]|uniref:Membrane protein n=1 Tax=Psychromicrobium lacuslunae TaxID=1618207 RepID=A0A0D4BYX9_9MICC|nr:hypothetical protein [Psychromicrobium lacuslunae]AJT41321.1 membrane protein [Psychromicrobium lacuslunae]
MSKVINVVRMQLTNKWTFLGIPAVILAGCFLLSLAIFAIIPNSVEFKFSGAGQGVIWYFFALGLQALTLTFPFSQGLSISRRAFYLGSMLLFGTVALVMALFYWVMGLIENATNGWGMNGHMFYLPWVSDGAWYATILFFFSIMMFLYLFGFWAATLYKRWQVNGVLVVTIGLAVIIVGLVALLTWQGWWLDFFGWFGAQSNLSIAGWLLALSVLLAGGSYLTLRRATP